MKKGIKKLSAISSQHPAYILGFLKGKKMEIASGLVGFVAVILGLRACVNNLTSVHRPIKPDSSVSGKNSVYSYSADIRKANPDFLSKSEVIDVCRNNLDATLLCQKPDRSYWAAGCNEIDRATKEDTSTLISSMLDEIYSTPEGVCRLRKK